MLMKCNLYDYVILMCTVAYWTTCSRKVNVNMLYCMRCSVHRECVCIFLLLLSVVFRKEIFVMLEYRLCLFAV